MRWPRLPATRSVSSVLPRSAESGGCPTRPPKSTIDPDASNPHAGRRRRPGRERPRLRHRAAHRRAGARDHVLHLRQRPAPLRPDDARQRSGADGARVHRRRGGHRLGGVHVKKGDLVVAPFAYSDGTCAFCREGLYTSCVHGGFRDNLDREGGQAEAARVPFRRGHPGKAPGRRGPRPHPVAASPCPTAGHRPPRRGQGRRQHPHQRDRHR
jgi:hypothetical protein